MIFLAKVFARHKKNGWDSGRIVLNL